ncbi:MAG: LysR family transcriptional regulator [Treponema sp.]|jgi:lysyl-tRNA synthetase class 2|nr:LysR family transcriptional regulator [Treponema sp.]
MDLERLTARARIIREIRAFFDAKNYLETDTPLLSPDLIPESCLEVFQTELLRPRGSRTAGQKLYLVPSPEIWMKKLIARHRVSMYQICKCFRNGEQEGRMHNPEFTMLEYYTMDADYLDSLSLTEELFGRLLETFGGSAPGTGQSGNGRAGGLSGNGSAGGSLPDNKPSLAPPFLRITVEEAFRRWAGFSLTETAARRPALRAEARRLGLEPPPDLDIPALYDLIFIHAVENRLPKDRPVVLMDYPAFVPCLAQEKTAPDGNPVRERWELYVNGIELANCYSEETDPEKVRDFFVQETAKKEQSALVKHKVDEDYRKIFAGANGKPFPRCSGTAMGLDRLVMILTGTSSIRSVIPFSCEGT